MQISIANTHGSDKVWNTRDWYLFPPIVYTGETLLCKLDVKYNEPFLVIKKVLRPCKSRLQRRSYCELVDDYQFIIK